MATVDSLEIKIDAEAKTASNAINNLITKLDSLATSLNKVNGSSLSGIANGVQRLGNAMQTMNNVKTADFTKIANGFKKFGEIDASKLYATSSALNNLSKGIASISSVNFNANGLNNLASAVSKFGSNMSTQATANLPQIQRDLTNFVQGMNSVGALNFDMTGLANLINSINRLGGKSATQATANLPTISAQLQNFVRQLNNIGSLNFDMTGINSLINGISKLGGKASTQAINNIPQLATALKNLMQTLSTAPQVSQNIINMTNALARLARTGASSGKAANSLSTSFTNLSRTSKNTIGSLNRIQSSFKGLFKSILPILGIRQLFNWGKEAIELSSDLTEVQNVVDVTFGDMSYKVEEFAKNSVEQFGMSELSLKQYASRFQAMGSAMGINKSLISSSNKYLNEQTNGYIGLSDSMSDVSLNLTKLTADMASFYNMEQADVAEDLESIFTGQTRPLREYGLDLTQATLQEWALKNGLDADMQSMSQAEKTMLRYQYVLANTGAAQGDFIRTADTWANQTRILKQNLERLASTIGGTLINALKPLVKALNITIGYIIQFAETVSNALGKIFGWTYEEGGSGGIADDWSSAAGSADDVAASTGTAADNAKKLKQQLQGFDELNVLTSDTPSSSGGGGGGGTGGSTAGGASGGKWTQGDSMIKSFESEIDSLYELGSYISDTLSDAMESIDWNSVYKKAQNFGSGLANFLNGLITPRLFGNVGKTIAGSLNTALNFLNSFGETFDWSNFGKSIASGINNYFETYDFALSAKTISTFAKGILEALTSALNNIKWENFGKSIADFISNIDWKGIAIDLLELAKAIANAIVDSIKGLTSTDTGKIALAIMGVLASLKFSSSSVLGTNILNSIGSSASLGNTKNLTGSLNKKLSGLALLATGVSITISEINEPTISGTVISTISNAFGALQITGKPKVALVTTVATLGFKLGNYAYHEYDSVKDWANGIVETLGNLITGQDIDLDEGELVYHAPDNKFNKNSKDILLGKAYLDIQTRTNGEDDKDGKKLTSLTKSYHSTWTGKNAAYKALTEVNGKNDIKLTGIKNAAKVFHDAWEGDTANYNAKTAVNGEYFKTEKGIKAINKLYHSTWTGDTAKYNAKSALNGEYNKTNKGLKSLNSEFNKAWTGTTAKYDITTQSNSELQKMGANSANQIFAGMSQKKISLQLANGTGDPLDKLIKGTYSLKVSQYATGGFPEDGWFRANKGEIMGRFDNGKSVVANNKQITDGISAAVYSGNKENNALLRQEINLLQRQNELLTELIKKDSGITYRDVFQAARKGNTEYKRINGRSAFT